MKRDNKRKHWLALKKQKNKIDWLDGDMQCSIQNLLVGLINILKVKSNARKIKIWGQSKLKIRNNSKGRHLGLVELCLLFCMCRLYDSDITGVCHLTRILSAAFGESPERRPERMLMLGGWVNRVKLG